MKRFMAPIFILFILASLSAKVSIGCDLASFDFLWEDGLRVDSEVRVEYNNIEITVPIRYGKSKDNYLNVIETGILIGVHPIDDWGLFVEASFLKLGWLWGVASLTEKMFFSFEGSVGWNAEIGMFSIRPRITYRVMSSSMEATESLKRIPQFGELRLSLMTGISFPL